jgi:hypothetical protein
MRNHGHFLRNPVGSRVFRIVIGVVYAPPLLLWGAGALLALA